MVKRSVAPCFYALSALFCLDENHLSQPTRQRPRSVARTVTLSDRQTLHSGSGNAAEEDGMKAYRGSVAALVVVVGLLAAPSAQAAINSVYGGEVTCAAQPSNGNIRACGGDTTSFGRYADRRQRVPAAGNERRRPLSADRRLPRLGRREAGPHHESGTHRADVPEPEAFLVQEADSRIQHWAEEGYAVFSMTDRGWQSCGRFDEPAKSEPECEYGYNHLMDDRYEVHDAQYLMSVLAEEGLVSRRRSASPGFLWRRHVDRACQRCAIA